MKSFKNNGTLLIATGILHTLVGLIMGWQVLTAIIHDGVVNTINDEPDRNATFWFLFSGFLMIMLGKLIKDYLEMHWRLPKWLGINLLALSLAGCIIMPVSGFWLVVPQAIWMLAPSGKRREYLI